MKAQLAFEDCLDRLWVLAAECSINLVAESVKEQDFSSSVTLEREGFDLLTTHDGTGSLSDSFGERVNVQLCTCSTISLSSEIDFLVNQRTMGCSIVDFGGNCVIRLANEVCTRGITCTEVFLFIYDGSSKVLVALSHEHLNERPKLNSLP